MSILMKLISLLSRSNTKIIPDNVKHNAFHKKITLDPRDNQKNNVTAFKTKSQIFLEKLAKKIIEDDCEINAFAHYTFIIDGEHHTFGIVELDAMGVFNLVDRIRRAA